MGLIDKFIVFILIWPKFVGADIFLYITYMKVHGVFCSDFNQTSLEDLCHVFDGSLTIMYQDFFHRFLPNIFLKSVR